MKYILYIIESEERYTYVGITDDLEKRLFQHNNKLAGWTKRGTNWNIIYTEEFDSLEDAMKREKWFKTGVGRDKIKEIKKPGS